MQVWMDYVIMIWFLVWEQIRSHYSNCNWSCTSVEVIWPFPAKGCWRMLPISTMDLEDHHDKHPTDNWSIWRNYFGGSNEFHPFQILDIVPDLKNLKCSVITQMERSKATSPAVQVKLRPGYMFLIMEVENCHSKTAFLYSVWSRKGRIEFIFNHTLTTKSNLTPQKINAWVEFWLKYHHSSWCPSLLISGHQPQLPPAVVLALRPHWLRRWRPRPTSPKKGHEHEPHRAKRTSWVGEGYIEKTCASNHILWKNG